MPTIGSLRWMAPGRAVELRIAVVEDPTVGGHEPVAAGIERSRHAHDGLVQVDATRGTVEVGVAVVEDPSVGGHQPVAPVVTCRRHTHDGLVEVHAPGVAVVGRITHMGHLAAGVHLVVADRSGAREAHGERCAVKSLDVHRGGAVSERAGKEADVHGAGSTRGEDDGVNPVAGTVG